MRRCDSGRDAAPWGCFVTTLATPKVERREAPPPYVTGRRERLASVPRRASQARRGARWSPGASRRSISFAETENRDTGVPAPPRKGPAERWLSPLYPPL
jgi:hypothetical protein